MSKTVKIEDEDMDSFWDAMTYEDAVKIKKGTYVHQKAPTPPVDSAKLVVHPCKLNYAVPLTDHVIDMAELESLQRSAIFGVGVPAQREKFEPFSWKPE